MWGGGGGEEEEEEDGGVCSVTGGRRRDLSACSNEGPAAGRGPPTHQGDVEMGGIGVDGGSCAGCYTSLVTGSCSVV